MTTSTASTKTTLPELVHVISRVLVTLHKLDPEDALERSKVLYETGYMDEHKPDTFKNLSKFADSNDVCKLATNFDIHQQYNLTTLQALGLLGAKEDFYLIVDDMSVFNSEVKARVGLPKNVKVVQAPNYAQYQQFHTSPDNNSYYSATFTFKNGKVLRVCQPPSTTAGNNPLFNKFTQADVAKYATISSNLQISIVNEYNANKLYIDIPLKRDFNRKIRVAKGKGMKKKKIDQIKSLRTLVGFPTGAARRRMKPRTVLTKPGRNYQFRAKNLRAIISIVPKLDLVMAHQLAYAWNGNADVNTLQNLVPGLQSSNLFMALFENWFNRMSATDQAKFNVVCDKIGQVQLNGNSLAIAKYGRWGVQYKNATIYEIVYSYWNPYKGCGFFSQMVKACLVSHGIKSVSSVAIAFDIPHPNTLTPSTPPSPVKYPEPLDTLDLTTLHKVTNDDEIKSVLKTRGFNDTQITQIIKQKVTDNITLSYSTTIPFLNYYWDCFLTNQVKNNYPIWNIALYNPRITAASDGAKPSMTLGTYLPYPADSILKPNFLREIINFLLISEPSFSYTLNKNPGLTIFEYHDVLTFNSTLPLTSIPGLELITTFIPNLDHISASINLIANPSFDPKKLENCNLEITMSLVPKTAAFNPNIGQKAIVSPNTSNDPPPPPLFSIPGVIDVNGLWISFPYSGVPLPIDTKNNPSSTLQGYIVGGSGTLLFANNLPITIDGYLGGGSLGLSIGAGPINHPFGLQNFSIDWVQLTIIRISKPTPSWDINVAFTLFLDKFSLTLSGSYATDVFNLQGALSMAFPSDPNDPSVPNEDAPDPEQPSTMEDLLHPLSNILGVDSIHSHSELANIGLTSVGFSISKAKSDPEPTFALNGTCTYKDYEFSFSATLGPKEIKLSASLTSESPSKSLTIIPGLVELHSLELYLSLATSASSEKTTFEFRGEILILKKPEILDIVYSNSVTFASITKPKMSLTDIIPIVPSILNISLEDVTYYGSNGAITLPNGRKVQDGFGFAATVHTLPPLISQIIPIPSGSIAAYADFAPSDFRVGLMSTKSIFIGKPIELLPFSLDFAEGSSDDPGSEGSEPGKLSVTASMGIKFHAPLDFLSGLETKGIISFSEDAFSIAIEIDNLKHPFALGIIVKELKFGLTFGPEAVSIDFLGYVIFNNGVSVVCAFSVTPEETFNFKLIKPESNSPLMATLATLPQQQLKSTTPWTLSTLAGAIFQLFDPEIKSNPPLPPIFEIDTFDLEIITATPPPLVKLDASVKLFKIVDFFINLTCSPTKFQFIGGIHELNLFGLKITGPTKEALINPKFPKMAWCKFSVSLTGLDFEYVMAGSISLFNIWYLDTEIKITGSATSGFHLIIDTAESFKFLGVSVGWNIHATAALDSHHANFSFTFDAHIGDVSDDFKNRLKKCQADLRKLKALVEQAEKKIGGDLERGLSKSNSDLDAAQKDVDTFADSVNADTHNAQHYLDSVEKNLENLENLKNYHNKSSSQYQAAQEHAKTLILELVKNFDSQINDAEIAKTTLEKKFPLDIAAAKADFAIPIHNATLQVGSLTTKCTDLQVQVNHKPSPPTTCGEICTVGIAYAVYLGELHEWKRAVHDLANAHASLDKAKSDLTTLENKQAAKIAKITAAYNSEHSQLVSDLKNLNSVKDEIDTYTNPTGPVSEYIQQLESHWNSIENDFHQASDSMNQDLGDLKKNVDTTTANAKAFNNELSRELSNALHGKKSADMRWLTDLQNTTSYLTDASDALAVLKILAEMERILDPGKWFTIHHLKFTFEAGGADDFISIDISITIFGNDLPDIHFKLDFTKIVHLLENIFKAVWDALKSAF